MPEFTAARDMIFALLIVARLFDMATTWVRTPDLSREINPVVRSLGWRGNLWCNIFIVVVLPPAFPRVAVATIILSFLAGAWNLCQIVLDKWR